MGWQNIFAVILEAGNTIINPAGVFVYSGPPATGNLLASISGTAGTDNFGNTYYEGVNIYGPNGSYVSITNNGTSAALYLQPPSATHITYLPQLFLTVTNPGAVNEWTFMTLSSGKESGNPDAAIQLFSAAANASSLATIVFEFGGAILAQLTANSFNLVEHSATPPAYPGFAALYGDVSGALAVVDGTDGQVYKTQRHSVVIAANTPVTSTALTAVLSATVQAPSANTRTYRVHGQVSVLPAQAAGGFAIAWGCAGATSANINFYWHNAVNGAPVADAAVAFVNQAQVTASNPGYVMTGAHTYSCVIEGTFVMPVNSVASFQIQMLITTAGDTCNVAAGSFMDIMPVT